MKRALLLVALSIAVAGHGRAAQLEGVTLPDTQSIGRTTLLLNGIALRTYSILQIPIYVAGLYLVHPDSDSDHILRSTDAKLLDIRFVHAVSEEKARAAWREGLEKNCASPCQLPQADIERFLASVPAMRKGDRFTMVFTGAGAEIAANGNAIGSIPNRGFATAILATFIGPQPPTARVKRELLGGHVVASGN